MMAEYPGTITVMVDGTKIVMSGKVKITKGSLKPKSIEALEYPTKNFSRDDLTFLAVRRFPKKKKLQRQWVDGLGPKLDLTNDEFFAVFRRNADNHYRKYFDEIEGEISKIEQEPNYDFHFCATIKYLIAGGRKSLKIPNTTREAAILATTTWEEWLSRTRPRALIGRKMKMSGLKSGNDRRTEQEAKYLVWQREALRLRGRHPEFSKSELARQVKRTLQVHESKDTIRKHL